MAVVGIIDYGLCNLDSIARAIEHCGGDPKVTADPGDLNGLDRIIIPGVGAFAKAMKNLRDIGLDQAIHEQRARRRLPVLGICLGMHLLAEESNEGGVTHGLGLLAGWVSRLVPSVKGERVPHIGWNEVWPEHPHPLFKGVDPRTDFYFVHSYHLTPADPTVCLAHTPYCGMFTSAVAMGDNVVGVQFHPEKSMAGGFKVLQNFLAL